MYPITQVILWALEAKSDFGVGKEPGTYVFWYTSRIHLTIKTADPIVVITIPSAVKEVAAAIAVTVAMFKLSPPELHRSETSPIERRFDL